MKTTIFISSVQKELATKRRALKDYVQGDPLLWKFFEVFLFEDLPASDRRADDVYLDEVDRCGVYVGLFGNEYGPENAEGISATEREFDRATARGKRGLTWSAPFHTAQPLDRRADVPEVLISSGGSPTANIRN